MTTYTITYDGAPPDRGLTAELTAEIILTHDRHLYEISADADYPGWFELLVSERSRNSSGGAGRLLPCHYDGGRLVRCEAPDAATAWARLAVIVADNLGSTLPASINVYTDAVFERLIAEDA